MKSCLEIPRDFVAVQMGSPLVGWAGTVVELVGLLSADMAGLVRSVDLGN